MVRRVGLTTRARWVAVMVCRILPMALLACLAGLAAAPASAETSTSTSLTRCYRDDRGLYQCQYHYDSPTFQTLTRCASGLRGSKCITDSETKAAPAPTPEPTVERDPGTGVLIMRGMPR